MTEHSSFTLDSPPVPVPVPLSVNRDMRIGLPCDSFHLMDVNLLIMPHLISSISKGSQCSMYFSAVSYVRGSVSVSLNASAGVGSNFHGNI